MFIAPTQRPVAETPHIIVTPPNPPNPPTPRSRARAQRATLTLPRADSPYPSMHRPRTSHRITQLDAFLATLAPAESDSLRREFNRPQPHVLTALPFLDASDSEECITDSEPDSAHATQDELVSVAAS